jgi:hypothetical protein
VSNFHGYQTDQDLILCDDMKIGDGSSTAIDKDTGDPEASGAAGRLIRVEEVPAEIRIYAHNDLTIPANKSLKISLEAYSDDTRASAAGPFRGTSGWQPARYFLFYKDSNDAQVAFSAGDLVTAMAIPQEFLHDRRYLQLRIQTDASLSGAGLDAFVRPVA